jgi:hypothetical protein
MTNFFDNDYTIGEQNLVLRQGDRLPSLVAQVVDEFGVIVDLTPYTVVNASLRRVSSGQGGDDWESYLPLTVLDPVVGIVKYDWQEFDTAFRTPGRYDLAMVLSDGTGIKITIPTERNAYITIRSRVAPLENFILATPAVQGGALLREPSAAGGHILLLPKT